MANVPVPTPIRLKTPPPPKPKNPTVTKHVPYNPLTGGMPSLGFLTNTANQHAQADTNQALAALPSVDDVRALATATAHLQQQNQAQLAQQAGSAGGAYNSAYQAAAAPSNAAMIASGGHAGAANTAAGGLLGALGTMMGQALGGQAAAANAQGAADINARNRQATQIKTGQAAAAAKYLDALKTEAFQIAQARANNQLANAQFGLSANTAANNASVAQTNASTAATNASTRATTTSQAAADKAAAARAKKAAGDKAAARAAVNHMEGMVRSMLAAKIPGPDKTDANGNLVHTTLPQYKPDAVRKAAVVYLVRQAGYSQASARRIVMQMFPFLPAPPADYTGPPSAPPGNTGGTGGAPR